MKNIIIVALMATLISPNLMAKKMGTSTNEPSVTSGDNGAAQFILTIQNNTLGTGKIDSKSLDRITKKVQVLANKINTPKAHMLADGITNVAKQAKIQGYTRIQTRDEMLKVIRGSKK